MTDAATEKDDTSQTNDDLQKDKDTYNCLKSIGCTDYKMKLIDCYEKIDRSTLPVEEICNKEIFNLIKSVDECLAKSKKESKASLFFNFG
ncbi:hypothetical protein NPIL_476371 [Nephila pilipes]|uniref:Uncharacterized protein n=1 Tax=Nephila pilipes TaxID=299642 RepID=A0A8X6Q065_NEPPI|nr:hypothetical protein NPIL_476371 [Nephila pilipes]